MFFDEAERPDEFAREAQVADGEIFDGARGGGAIHCVRRDGHFTHGVAFDARLASLVSHEGTVEQEVREAKWRNG